MHPDRVTADAEPPTRLGERKPLVHILGRRREPVPFELGHERSRKLGDHVRPPDKLADHDVDELAHTTRFRSLYARCRHALEQ